MSCVDVEAGILKAAEIADKALDIVRTRFKAELRLKVVRESYVVLRKNGTHRGSASSGNESPLIKHAMAIDFRDFSEDPEILETFKKTATYLFLTKDVQSSLEQKISDCIHWYRKGEEADRLEDKLLHYWIVMEKIFTFSAFSRPLIKGNEKIELKITLISELLSACVAFAFIYRLGWTLYSYLRGLVGSDLQRFLGGTSLTLPKELVEKCCLQTDFSGRVYLKNIVENLSELSKAVDKRLVRNRIMHAKHFYDDGAFAKREIEKIVARTKEDVLLIYRYRNSIVHNAHYDPSLLQPFAEKAAELAHLALAMLIKEREDQPAITVEEIFVSKHCEVQRILERLDKNLPVDFLDDVPTWNVKGVKLEAASEDIPPPRSGGGMS